MPLYEYYCRACRRLIELFHGSGESREGRRCHCGEPVEARISSGILSSSFRPYVEYNISDSPVMVHSAAEIDRIADSNGLRVQGTFPGKKRWKQDNSHRGPYQRLLPDRERKVVSVPRKPT